MLVVQLRRLLLIAPATGAIALVLVAVRLRVGMGMAMHNITVPVFMRVGMFVLVGVPQLLCQCSLLPLPLVGTGWNMG